MCMVDDADSVNLLRCDTVKARKDHSCKECGRVIHKGETHTSEAFVWEGELKGWRTCAHCIQVRLWLLNVCDGWLYGGVMEDFLEHWDQVFPRGLSFGKMMVMARRRWREGADPVPSERMLEQAIASSIGHD